MSKYMYIEVNIDRIEYGRATIKVEANNLDEARAKAEAGDFEPTDSGDNWFTFGSINYDFDTFEEVEYQ